MFDLKRIIIRQENELNFGANLASMAGQEAKKPRSQEAKKLSQAKSSLEKARNMCSNCN